MDKIAQHVEIIPLDIQLTREEILNKISEYFKIDIEKCKIHEVIMN